MSRLLRGVARALLGRRVTVAAAPAATPFFTTLQTMDMAFRGYPFVEGHAKGTNLQTMDMAFRGYPFVIYKKAS